MSSITIEVDLPEDWARFSLPPALDARLTALLDQQDQSVELTEAERQEAVRGFDANWTCHDLCTWNESTSHRFDRQGTAFHWTLSWKARK